MVDLNLYPTAWTSDQTPYERAIRTSTSSWSCLRVASTLRLASYFRCYCPTGELGWMACFVDHLCNFRPAYMSVDQFKQITINSERHTFQQHLLYEMVLVLWSTSLSNTVSSSLRPFAQSVPIVRVVRLMCEAVSALQTIGDNSPTLFKPNKSKRMRM
jgi:hypothetical protein